MAKRLTVAIDWDGTLVGPEGDWLPGAHAALTALLTRGHRVLIHTCRANWDGGIDQIQERLGPLATKVTIHPKVDADLYVDDKAHHFTGDWTPVLALLRHQAR